MAAQSCLQMAERAQNCICLVTSLML